MHPPNLSFYLILQFPNCSCNLVHVEANGRVYGTFDWHTKYGHHGWQHQELLPRPPETMPSLSTVGVIRKPWACYLLGLIK